MKKLNEKNANFAIVRTAFHGGGIASFHKSLKAAKRLEKTHSIFGCDCGCCSIIPITEEARKELKMWEKEIYGDCEDYIPLLRDIPFYQASGESPYDIVR
jgi:hypothetical protein